MIKVVWYTYQVRSEEEFASLEEAFSAMYWAKEYNTAMPYEVYQDGTLLHTNSKFIEQAPGESLYDVLNAWADTFYEKSEEPPGRWDY